MADWTTLASEESIAKTQTSLTANGFNVMLVASGAEAKDKLLGLIPQGSEVSANTSVTLDTIGVTQEIDETGKYDSVRKKVHSLDKEKERKQMNSLRSVPDYAVGSAHAVTEDGRVLVASKTGSQLPSYAYGSQKVILVVGTQKIVKDIDSGIKRIYEHALPLEDKRALKAYGVGSSVNRILILAKEEIKDRTTIILVKENLGF